MESISDIQKAAREHRAHLDRQLKAALSGSRVGLLARVEAPLAEWLHAGTVGNAPWHRPAVRLLMQRGMPPREAARIAGVRVANLPRWLDERVPFAPLPGVSYRHVRRAQKSEAIERVFELCQELLQLSEARNAPLMQRGTSPRSVARWLAAVPLSGLEGAVAIEVLAAMHRAGATIETLTSLTPLGREALGARLAIFNT